MNEIRINNTYIHTESLFHSRQLRIVWYNETTASASSAIYRFSHCRLEIIAFSLFFLKASERPIMLRCYQSESLTERWLVSDIHMCAINPTHINSCVEVCGHTHKIHTPDTYLIGFNWIFPTTLSRAEHEKLCICVCYLTAPFLTPQHTHSFVFLQLWGLLQIQLSQPKY